ncbi:MAG: T9SS type A sorting domain-containing protein [Ignavibacteria bacterium]|nr:T9SS type A sorting domain-containing protein [Ignavibacteria bacterium]
MKTKLLLLAFAFLLSSSTFSFAGGPNPPQNLVVTADYFGTTENPFKPFLTWDSVQGNNIQYKIYRALSTGGTPNFIHIGNSNTNSYLDNMILYTFNGGGGICEYQFKTFLYRVTAIDTLSQESDPSNSDSISGYLDPCGPDEKSKIKNNQFELKKLLNYPNPFNPFTFINFEINNPANVSLIVYDINGKEISKLLNNENISKGEHRIKFNADYLPTGVYFYKLTTNEFSKINKMLLIK